VIKDTEGNVIVGRTKNYLREGKWYGSYPDHARKSFGKYHNGLAEGRHIGYWRNGKISSIIDYTAGKHDGHFIELSENGDTLVHSYFSMDVPEGYFYSYSKETETKIRGAYTAGKKSGWWTTSNGVITDSCEYSLGIREGKQIIRGPGNNLVIGYFKQGFENGAWKEYVEGRLRLEYWYDHGVKSRYRLLYFPDSDSLYCITRYHAPGDPEQFAVFQSPGVIGKREWYSGGLVDSIHTYHANGKIRTRSIYQCNFGVTAKLQQCNSYDSTGAESFRLYASTDGKDSIRYDYNRSGIVIRKTLYHQGAIRGNSYYYANGKTMLVFSNDEIIAYAENGKILKAGTPGYNKIFSQLDSLDASFGSLDIFGDAEMPESPITLDAVAVFQPGETGAMFPGGPDSMQAFIRRNLKYPVPELEMNVEGLVRIQFNVEPDGRITSARAIQEVKGGPGLAREALRVVNSMPLWQPQIQNGQPVRSIVVLPFKFSTR